MILVKMFVLGATSAVVKNFLLRQQAFINDASQLFV